jgi:NADH-quinone oxidoreductase subunit H
VSGYKVEYAGAPFALFFIGEYAKIIIMKLVSVLLFFGGSSPFLRKSFGLIMLIVKIIFLVFGFL